MLDALPFLLALLAYGLPLPACIAAIILARRWRLRGADPGLPSALSARPLGLIGLAVCVLTGIAAFQVPLTMLGGAGGNALAIALMALVCTGAALGAAAFGQRRARWAGALAIAIAIAEWLAGGCLLFFSNVGTGMPGRPLRRRGVPVLPRVRRGGTRADCLPLHALARGLAEPTRRALARAWEEDARYEAASVPAFEHLAHDLEVARAPEVLIAWARRAAAEEVGHARLCFALAGAYAGRAVVASPRPFAPAWVRRTETRCALLERLAVEALVDGCVGEGAAALGAARGAERAEAPVVESVLRRVAREEQTHAELAWAIIDWLLGEMPQLASALSSRLERLESRPGEATERAWDGDLACHGRVSPGERVVHLREARELAKDRLAAGARKRPDDFGVGLITVLLRKTSQPTRSSLPLSRSLPATRTSAPLSSPSPASLRAPPANSPASETQPPSTAPPAPRPEATAPLR
jgi:hypothetical protein